MEDVKKAYEITDAKITFVSLVDKAANLKTFLITKADDGKAEFSTYGRIVKKDAEHHYVTGVVYEPLAEDAHGNFMTEEEITKAAYYFAKNGNKVDLQHSFEPLEDASVVESWIAKADFSIGDEQVKKGTWLMTVEINDDEIWKAVENGDITGFSMGGMGVYSQEDVDLSEVEKNAPAEPEQEQDEKKGLFKRLAELLGFSVVEKGEFADRYEMEKKANDFWSAFYTLEDLLCRYDWYSDTEKFEEDAGKVDEALSEFETAIKDVLTGGTEVTKAVMTNRPVEKAGKKISSANKDTLQGIYDSLGAFLAQFDEQEEPAGNADTQGEADPDEDITKSKDKSKDKEEQDMDKEAIEKMVEEAVNAAVTKAMGEQEAEAKEPETVTEEDVQKMVDSAVEKAMENIRKQRGVPSALNDGEEQVEKSEEHYLHGIL